MDSTTDSATDVTMSGIQNPASSVGSDALLDIDPRLLTDQTEILPSHESIGMELTDKDLENCLTCNSLMVTEREKDGRSTKIFWS